MQISIILSVNPLINKGIMISQDEFNKLMETYEESNYSIIYDIGIFLMRITNMIGIAYLVIKSLTCC